MKKTLLALAAFSLLYGGTLSSQSHANSMLSKNAIIQGDSAVQLTAAKKKTMKMEAAKKTAKKSTKKIKHRMRRSKHKGCGTFMYRSKKTGKCIDARA